MSIRRSPKRNDLTSSNRKRIRERKRTGLQDRRMESSDSHSGLVHSAQQLLSGAPDGGNSESGGRLSDVLGPGWHGLGDVDW